MNPNLIDETRKYFDNEMAYWQAQSAELQKKQLAAIEETMADAKARLQAIADAQNAAVLALWKHQTEAFERGMKLMGQNLAP